MFGSSTSLAEPTKRKQSMTISQFTYKDATFDVTFNNGYIAYTFEHNGKRYGIKLKPASKKTIDVASAAFNLALNAIETYENIRLREGDSEA